MIRKQGYPAEAHVIPTEDGYLLTLHRIPGDENSPSIFLQHGLLGSSADWVMPGKNQGLGMIFNYSLKLKIINKQCIHIYNYLFPNYTQISKRCSKGSKYALEICVLFGLYYVLCKYRFN